MDRFLCIQAFVQVAECQSFVNAARQLGVTPSVITSRIKQLETFVETPLFHRSTRSVTLSDAGTSFFQECAELVNKIDSVTDRMRLAKSTPSGMLRMQVLPGCIDKTLALRDLHERLDTQESVHECLPGLR